MQANLEVRPVPTEAHVTEPLVRLRDVTRNYAFGQTRVQALRGVTLDVYPGEMVAVWGPSGSGKSTLMNLMGLIDAPDSGSVSFMGTDVSGLGDDQLSEFRARRVGFVFQSFNLVPVLSVLENVMMPMQIQGMGSVEAARLAREWISEVGLVDFESFWPDRLSGGQRQRAAIARALVTRPSLVIADEPTAALDSHNSSVVIDLMQTMNAKTGTTFVFSTHDPRLLERIPRTVLLQDGLVGTDINRRMGS